MGLRIPSTILITSLFLLGWQRCLLCGWPGWRPEEAPSLVTRFTPCHTILCSEVQWQQGCRHDIGISGSWIWLCEQGMQRSFICMTSPYVSMSTRHQHQTLRMFSCFNPVLTRHLILCSSARLRSRSCSLWVWSQAGSSMPTLASRCLRSNTPLLMESRWWHLTVKWSSWRWHEAMTMPSE